MLRTLSRLPEPELTKEVILPLLNKILPGRVEYTHSANEAGRDLVLFTTDELGNEKIVCVQVKTTKLSYGASAFGAIVTTLETARREGVTLINGTKQHPQEVWFINSQPFPENERRQVSDSLSSLARSNIKLIPGEELLAIIQRRAPELLSYLLTPDERSISKISKRLYAHAENRAFGHLPERMISDFYITATITPSQGDVLLALNNHIEIKPATKRITIPLKNILSETNEERPPKATAKNERALHARAKSELLAKARLDVGIRTFGITTEADFTHPLSKIRSIKKGSYISADVTFNSTSALQRLTELVHNALEKCPEQLEKDTSRIREGVQHIHQLQDFLEFCSDKLEQDVLISPPKQEILFKRIKVPNPEHILGISSHILIDGPPGCGKTTFMRVLAVRLIEQKRRVRLVYCSRITTTENRKQSFNELISEHCEIAKGRPIEDNDIILLDALDEGPSWLTKMVNRELKTKRSLLLTTRTSHIQDGPKCFTHIQLASFSGAERDEFLDRWLTGQTQIRKRAADLILLHPDIDLHTRLPLIATILVTLLIRDRTPHTRAAIYDQRLQMLLSDWDCFRDVERATVRDPSAKSRLLAMLAFYMHEKRISIIPLSKIEVVYEKALGRRGYVFSFDNIIYDIVKINGILFEDAPDRYSFGHLTFQEHLTGVYMHTMMRVDQVAGYLGDSWWAEALKFWACIRGQIDDLVQLLQRESLLSAHAKQVRDLAENAPYTCSGAFDAIVDSLEELSIEQADAVVDHAEGNTS